VEDLFDVPRVDPERWSADRPESIVAAAGRRVLDNTEW